MSEYVSPVSGAPRKAAGDEGEGYALPPIAWPPGPHLSEDEGPNPHEAHVGAGSVCNAYLQRCWATTSRETPTFTVSPQARTNVLLTLTPDLNGQHRTMTTTAKHSAMRDRTFGTSWLVLVMNGVFRSGFPRHHRVGPLVEEQAYIYPSR